MLIKPMSYAKNSFFGEKDEQIICIMVFAICNSIQGLICCLSNRGETVSMDHLKEIGVACVNMSGIPKQ